MTGIEGLSKEDVQYNLNYLKSVIDKCEETINFQKDVKKSYREKLYFITNFCIEFEWYDLSYDDMILCYSSILNIYYNCFTKKDKLKSTCLAPPAPEPINWRDKYKTK